MGAAKEEKRPGNVQESIHLRDYWKEFLNKPIRFQTLMADEGRKKASLSGLWHYSIDPFNTCLRSRWYKFSTSESVYWGFRHMFSQMGINEEDFPPEVIHELDLVKIARTMTPMDFDFDEWPTLELPACWNMVSERLFLYEGPMVFTRMFEVDVSEVERVFLRIGAANYRCVIFLNGKLMGSHLGGSTDFYVELTEDILETGNRLILVDDNTRRDTHVPMDNFDWFNYGGIYRDIELVFTPTVFIKNYNVFLVPDGTFRNMSCKVSLSDPVDGEAVLNMPELGTRISVPVTGGEGETRFSVEAILWNPERPKLYDVSIEYNGDKLSDRVGFREIRIAGEKILLNGTEIFLKGISCHEESVANGKALSVDEIRENLGVAKELGCNFVRLAHYPHSRETAKLADELGMMLWEEIPVYWAIDFGNPDTLKDAENQMTELILRDWRRASVIIWSVGNENEDSDARLSFMSRLAGCCRDLDSTRPVSAACLVNWESKKIDDRLAEHLDIVGINEYFGWYHPGIDNLRKFFENTDIPKPFVITEMGAGARSGRRGPSDEFFTEEKQAAVYEEQLEAIKKTPQIRGISPWILYDFRSLRRTNPIQDYYNLKGLLSADKTYRKPAFFVLQSFYTARAKEIS